MQTENKAVKKYLNCGYGIYFTLSIDKKINERQHRNSLNINYLFHTVLSQGTYTKYDKSYPKVNNGLYHHIGKSHSKYPKN